MINIVIVANDGYVQHAAVMLTSLFESNIGSTFRVFLLTDGISEESHSRLETLCKAYGSVFYMLTPEEELRKSHSIDISGLPSGKWSTMIYYKLFMPSVLPSDVDRCLFLDVDMVVVDDIRPLYNIVLKDNAIIAAVEDVVSCMPRKEALGLSPEDYYINSGVMVCDIVAWRAEEKKRPIFSFVQEWSNRAINEQDNLAVYMKGRILLLSLRWNMVACNYLRKRFVFPKYYNQLTQARKHPAIHHFCTMIQPWYADSPHPYRHLYKRYLKIYIDKIGISASLDLPYKEKPKSFYQKFRNMVGRILNFFDIIKQDGYILHPLRY